MSTKTIEKKRERCSNFKTDEKKILCSLVKEFFNVIENKKTDKVSSKEKEKAWEDIAVRHNASATGVKRDSKQLKTFYDNWRRRTKKAIVVETAETRATVGEAPPLSSLDDADLELLRIISDKTTTLEYPYEFNANVGKFYRVTPKVLHGSIINLFYKYLFIFLQNHLK
uniref:Regulatory protein zeste n=1 Tax=Cacopsylla melanoneura TaxID=428564 RepID=A0A8D9E6V5_9HEMI